MYAVRGICPSGAICTVRAKFRTHRDARRYMLARENELRARFGMHLYVAGI